MSESERKVFLHYTQAELDRNYDQRAWSPNFKDYFDRYAGDSEATRRKIAHRTFKYGTDDDEELDVFLASKSGAPTVFFIHGGAWRNFTKNDFSFVATRFVEAGLNFIIVNFSKLPQKRLPQVVDQLRRAIKWSYNNAKAFDGDRDKFYLVGQSSGAHLSAVVLTTAWPEFGLPSTVIKGATLISGSYDLQPAILSARGSYISVSPDEMLDLSPLYFTDRLSCPVFVVYAASDTDEFRRQSAAFAEAARSSGKLKDAICLPGIGHFAVLDELCKPSSVLLDAVLRHQQEVITPH